MLWFKCPKLIEGFVADAAVYNPNGTKTLLADALSTFFINVDPGFSNGSINMPRNPPDCIILDIWIFYNLILVDELLAIALRSFETCYVENSSHH